MKQGSGFGFYILLMILIIFFWLYFSGNPGPNYTQSQLDSAIANGKVSSVVIDQNEQVPTGTAHITIKDSDSQYTLYVSDVNQLQDQLSAAGISFSMNNVPQNRWVQEMLPMMIIVAALFILFMILMNSQMGAGMSAGAARDNRMMNFGRSRARLTDQEDVNIRFSDVAGLMEEKEELAEVVDFLRSPDKYIRVGARIPKGLLLVGPPGTGKTLLGKAVAGEAGVPFFSISGSDFVEMFVGVGASRVRDLFKEAKAKGRCIVFIDEIDAVARRRGSGMGGGHDEREQTLNQLLVEMDGFSENDSIIVMAATNRVDILDPAIMRPGRFDRKVFVGRPDVVGREEILNVHAKNKRLSDDVDLKQIAQTTAGFTGADLENLLNEAAIRAAKEDRHFIEQADIRQSFVKVGIGTEKKSKRISEKEKRITAYHESGHAILFHVLPDVGPVYSVSIIPTGIGAAGYTMPLPENDDMFNTKGKMMQDIIVSLGGRVAEELILDDITTGASNDLKKATATARNMVTKYGFSSAIGPISYAQDEEEVFLGRDYGHVRGYGEDIASTIDAEVKRIVEECYDKARELIRKHEDVLHRSAGLLLEKEKIGRSEFEALFGDEVFEKDEDVLASEGVRVEDM